MALTLAILGLLLCYALASIMTAAAVGVWFTPMWGDILPELTWAGMLAIVAAAAWLGCAWVTWQACLMFG